MLNLADDKPSLVNGIECAITIPEDVRPFLDNFDETDHPFYNATYGGFSRCMTYTSEDSPRSGCRSIRGSDNTTGVYRVESHREIFLPLYIYDPSVKYKENFQIKVDWVKNLQNCEIKIWMTYIPIIYFLRFGIINREYDRTSILQIHQASYLTFISQV